MTSIDLGKIAFQADLLKDLTMLYERLGNKTEKILKELPPMGEIEKQAYSQKEVERADQTRKEIISSVIKPAMKTTEESVLVTPENITRHKAGG